MGSLVLKPDMWGTIYLETPSIFMSIYMAAIRQERHWLPIVFCAQLKVLLMTYEALDGLGPGCLKDHHYQPTCALCCAREDLLMVPSSK